MVSYLKFKKRKNKLSAITAPSAIFTQGFATSGLLTKMHQSAILAPAFCSCNYNAKKSSRRSRLYVDRYRPLESSIYLLISFSLL